MALRCQNSVKNDFAFLRIILLSFKGFLLSCSFFFTFPQIFLLSFKNFLLLSFKYFLLSFKYFFAFLRFFFFTFLQIFLLSLNIHSNICYFPSNIFYCFPSNISLLSFKYFCFPSNIFAFLQILLLSFKAFSLLSFFFKKIGMTKFYQLENQSI